ncbi:MAG: fumarylacetoacetate hydrolase family protein [Rhodobacteraceae bacterium]|nr:fumarylacetoacetate hydrolase family protein [Paracoccaceae bacterium]
MKLVTYRRAEGPPRLGVMRDGGVLDASALGAAFGREIPPTMQGLIDAGPRVLDLLRALAGSAPPPGAPGSEPLASVTLLAPLPRPRNAIVGIGLNYRGHAAEAGVPLPPKPVVFFKPARTIIGPGAPIPHDASVTRQLDWEVELAVVIGRTARRVPAARALDHVFGYSVMIDLSARDAVRAGQMDLCKAMDGYGPFGPCIVTADEIPDPQTLTLWLRVNGVEKQHGRTDDMVFGVAELIEDLSASMTLEPGDVIASGTPGGVGAGRRPPEWLWPGDEVEAGIEGVGSLLHRVIDDTPA